MSFGVIESRNRGINSILGGVEFRASDQQGVKASRQTYEVAYSFTKHKAQCNVVEALSGQQEYIFV
jgi:hypothetical protein